MADRFETVVNAVLAGRTVHSLRDDMLFLALQLASRGHPDARVVLGVALRDVVNLNVGRRPQELELYIKVVGHCIHHFPGDRNEFISALIQLHNKLLDRSELRLTVMNLHLILRSVLLHFRLSGADAALVDLTRKAKNFSKHPDVERLKVALTCASTGTADQSQTAQLDPHTEVRMWLDKFESRQVPIGLDRIVALAAASHVVLPDDVWQEAVLSGTLSVMAAVAKRRLCERRFDWTPPDFNLVLLGIERRPEEAQPLFDMLFDNVGNFEVDLSSFCRFDLWWSLFWSPRARRRRTTQINLYAACLLLHSPKSAIPAATKQAKEAKQAAVKIVKEVEMADIAQSLVRWVQKQRQ